MAYKNYIKYCENKIKEIESRMRAGKAEFGDKRLLKMFREDLNCKKKHSSGWDD